MLSVFRRLGRNTAAGFRASAPARKLQSLHHRYRPGLIGRLREQHKQLLGLFADLEQACELADAGTCRKALCRFTAALQDHLAFENRYLYGYFSRHGHADSDIALRIETMATDMMHVGRILQRFVGAWAGDAPEASLVAQLRRDLGAVGEVLAHRIHEEEAVLYPLYSPPKA